MSQRCKLCNEPLTRLVCDNCGERTDPTVGEGIGLTLLVLFILIMGFLFMWWEKQVTG